MKSKIFSLLLITLMTIQSLNAQKGVVLCGGGGDPPPPPPPPPPPSCPQGINIPETNTSWGFYNWQVDGLQLNTTMLTSEMDFASTPNDFPGRPGFTQITINIPSACAARQVHEVHGNVALEVQPIDSCLQNASAIAQVVDQNGNNIASGFLLHLGSGEVNIKVKGKLSTPLSVRAFTLQFFLNVPCRSQVVSWSLAMS